MTTPSIEAIQEIVRETAMTEIMPHFRALSKNDIHIKHDKSFVTAADQATERVLTARLQELLPGSVTIGEESFEQDPTILSRFNRGEKLWVIDPIDGTRQFINGIAEFGVIIALVDHKQPVASVIHDPSTGDMLTAERGGGVWLNGSRMRLAGQDADAAPHGIISWNMYHDLPKNQPGLASTELASSSSFSYPRLFTGAIHFAGSKKPRATFLLCEHSKPWDHVAGLMMVDEAKGYAADLLGHAYEMEESRNNGLLIAADRPTWDKAYREFLPVIKPFLGSSK